MEEKVTVSKGGIGFVGLLQIAFIVLKLCKVINWSWWLVMLPALIEGGILIIALLLIVIGALLSR
jgi:hypothetical protein